MTGAVRGLLRRPETWLVLFVLSVCLALAPGAIDNIDTRICFRSALSWLDRGSFALADPTALEQRGLWAAPGLDGAWYPKFGPAVAALLLPFAWAGEHLASILRSPPRVAAEFTASLASSVFVAAGAFAAFRLARDTLRVSAAAAVTGTLAWVLGTFQLSYSGSSYLETPLGIAVLLGLFWATRAEKSPLAAPLLCGACAGLVVAIKVAAAVYVPFILLPLLTRDTRALVRRTVLAAIPLVVTAGWLAWINIARFGSATDTGYAPFDTLFRTPLLVGLHGYLLDPDLSIVRFAPAFALGVLGWRGFAHRAPLLFWGALGVLVSGAILHAKHTGYHGGTVLGPRYLVPVIPVLTACGVAVLRESAPGGLRKGLLTAALALCALLQVPSVLVAPNEYHTIRGEFRSRGLELADAELRWRMDWTLLGWKLRGQDERYDLRLLARDPARVPADPWYDVPHNDRGLAVWWVLAARQGRPVAWAFGSALIAAALVGAWGLRRTAASRGGSLRPSPGSSNSDEDERAGNARADGRPS